MFVQARGVIMICPSSRERGGFVQERVEGCFCPRERERCFVQVVEEEAFV
jgi:hypothetical protein